MDELLVCDCGAKWEGEKLIKRADRVIQHYHRDKGHVLITSRVESKAKSPTLTRAESEARLTDEVIGHSGVQSNREQSRAILLAALFPEVPRG